MSKRGARWLAMQAGEDRYISDKPCKNGHLGERKTATGTCLECRRINEYNRYHNDAKFIEKIRDKTRRRRARTAELARAWRAKRSPERIEADLEYQRKASRKRHRENPKDRLFYSRKHLADRAQRTPAWANLTEMKSIYKSVPDGYEVDHIVPLRAKLASGLHVEYNLQHLPRKENASKKNKFDPHFLSAEHIAMAKSAIENMVAINGNKS